MARDTNLILLVQTLQVAVGTHQICDCAKNEFDSGNNRFGMSDGRNGRSGHCDGQQGG